MPPAPLPLLERVSKSFSQLTNVAADLNAVSDELGKSMAQIDEALKKLNLGITVWVQINNWSYPRSGRFEVEDLGYAKINGKWGISLRIRVGEEQDPDEADEELWLFSDAPRALRLSAIDKLPELLENLSKEAVKAAAQVRTRLANVKDVVAALSPKLAQAHIAKQKAEMNAEIAKQATLLAEQNLIASDVMEAATKLLGGSK